MLQENQLEKSSCDATAPQPVETSLSKWLRNSEANWHRDARYAIVASPPFDTKDPKVLMARWLTYQSAEAITKKWWECNLAKNGGIEFGSLYFGIQLEMPASRPATTGGARVGDLLIVPVTVATEHRDVSRSFWLVARVEQAAQGRVIEYSDRSGQHTGCPKKSVLVPADQLDEEAAQQKLAEHAENRSIFKGEYSSPDHVLRVIRPALRRPEPSCQADSEFMALIDRYCDRYACFTTNRQAKSGAH